MGALSDGWCKSEQYFAGKVGKKANPQLVKPLAGM